MSMKGTLALYSVGFVMLTSAVSVKDVDELLMISRSLIFGNNFLYVSGSLPFSGRLRATV